MIANLDNSLTIRPAVRADITSIYAIAKQSLTLDVFTEDLFGEKLFYNPYPEKAAYKVFLAEIDGTPVGFMQSVTRPEERKAWVGVFAVLPDCRRKGVASRLLDVVKAEWTEISPETVEAVAIPGNYFNPGIDPRYTEALCFLEAKGFERFKDCVNMIARLDREFDTTGEAERLSGLTIEVRRASDKDKDLLEQFFQSDFGAEWLAEADLAMKNDPAGLHIAIKEGKIIAFSAHSSQNREWGFFGPMGTTPAARGTGIGRVLLWLCLNDLRNAGHKTAVIPWVGPIGFYSRYVDARVDRVFWRYMLKTGS